MTTLEMLELRRRNGIILLPVGCVEMHDAHVGLACDSFLAEAACRILAEVWDAVVMPTVHYTYPGATARWPGTVSVRPIDAMSYMMAVVKAIVRNGFKRIFVVSLHGPNSPMIQLALRNVFEDTGALPALLEPAYNETCARIREEYGRPHDEAALYLASLYICGRHGEFDPACSEADAQPRRLPAIDSMKALKGTGVSMPYHFVSPYDHVGRLPGLTLDDAPRIAQMYRDEILKKVGDRPANYQRYQEEMWAKLQDAPWDSLKTDGP